MSSFTSPLIVTPMADGRRWILFRKFRYHIGGKFTRRIISVPAGFKTDFASIPKPLLPLLPFWAKYSKAAPIHDLLYRTQKIMGKPITREQADKIFLEAMLVNFRCHKSGKLVAYLEYWAVRLFAQKAWQINVREAI